VPCTLLILDAVRAGRDWSCRVRMTHPLPLDQQLYGATAKQARDLALGLFHCLLDRGKLKDARGKRVTLPGRSLPRAKRR